MKAVIFHPAASAAIRAFPEDVRQELGKAIYDFQKGAVLAMPLSRPMPSHRVRRCRVANPRPVWNLSRFLLQPFPARHFGVSRIREKEPRHAVTRTGFGKEAVKGPAP